MKLVQAIEQTHGMQTLTPNEIAAVTGGPEGSVGTGLSPPAPAIAQAAQGLRVLSRVETHAVAGGPECEVGSGVTPPT